MVEGPPAVSSGPVMGAGFCASAATGRKIQCHGGKKVVMGAIHDCVFQVNSLRGLSFLS